MLCAAVSKTGQRLPPGCPTAAACRDPYHPTDVQRCYVPDRCHICHLATATPVSVLIPLERTGGEMPLEINGIIIF